MEHEDKVADDNLFEGTEEGKEGAEGTQEGAEGKPQNQDMAQIAQQLEGLSTALAAQQAQGVNQDHVVALAQGIKSLQDKMAAQEQGDPAKQGALSAEDIAFRELAQNPKEYVQKLAAQTAVALMGPHLKTQAEQRRDEILTGQMMAVEQEYGEGAWQDLFAEEFNAVVSKLPLEMQSSREHVDAAVNTVLGRAFRDPERKAKLEERTAAMAKKAEQAAEAPHMLGGYRPRPPANKLVPEEKQFLADLEKSGFKMSEKDYLQARDGERTESWWAEQRQAALGNK